MPFIDLRLLRTTPFSPKNASFEIAALFSSSYRWWKKSGNFKIGIFRLLKLSCSDIFLALDNKLVIGQPGFQGYALFTLLLETGPHICFNENCLWVRVHKLFSLNGIFHLLEDKAVNWIRGCVAIFILVVVYLSSVLLQYFGNISGKRTLVKSRYFYVKLDTFRNFFSMDWFNT